jgi:hypothetical protein
MPTKFKPDSFEYVGTRGNRKQVLVKNYIKATSKDELINYLNDENGKPKIKQKCLNELTRRGIKIKWISEKSNELDLSGLR